jgi:hypothetical protein
MTEAFMKISPILSVSLLCGLTVGCAPVASSVPKTKTQIAEDRLLTSNLAAPLRSVEVKVESVDAASFEAYEQSLPSSYRALERLRPSVRAFDELLETRMIKDFVLPKGQNPSEVLVVLKITGGKSHVTKASTIKGELFRSVERPDYFRLDLSKGETQLVWERVKNRIVEVAIFHRETLAD